MYVIDCVNKFALLSGEQIVLPRLFHEKEGREEEITRRTSFQDRDQLDDSAQSSPSGIHGNGDHGNRRFTTDDGISMGRVKASLSDKRCVRLSVTAEGWESLQRLMSCSLFLSRREPVCTISFLCEVIRNEA